MKEISFQVSHLQITAIAQLLEDIGEKAVNILLDQIRCGGVMKPEREVFPVKFMERESSGEN